MLRFVCWQPAEQVRADERLSRSRERRVALGVGGRNPVSRSGPLIPGCGRGSYRAVRAGIRRVCLAAANLALAKEPAVPPFLQQPLQALLPPGRPLGGRQFKALLGPEEVQDHEDDPRPSNTEKERHRLTPARGPAQPSGVKVRTRLSSLNRAAAAVIPWGSSVPIRPKLTQAASGTDGRGSSRAPQRRSRRKNLPARSAAC
jgi:hypothetical protein